MSRRLANILPGGKCDTTYDIFYKKMLSKPFVLVSHIPTTIKCSRRSITSTQIT